MVHDQQDWYASRAHHHQRSARICRTTMLAMEVVGVAGALAKASGVVDFPLAGIAAPVALALAAWNATHQHNATATAYRMASRELALIRTTLNQDLTEQQWSTAVVDAETVISREHTRWHANRTR
ncbi:SLATT domain-containing protein [Saccharopolyspora sp. 5N708]|uniref:SLATT domain-containing protein n=1 Tax=Saccharopolyspora sp. 5N708 TaxID=3457424 RepID=UPI003FD4F9EF